MIPLHYRDRNAPPPAADLQTREYHVSVACAWVAATLTALALALLAVALVVGVRLAWAAAALASLISVAAIVCAVVAGLFAWSANRYSHGALSRRPFEAAVVLLLIAILILIGSCAGLGALR